MLSLKKNKIGFSEWILKFILGAVLGLGLIVLSCKDKPTQQAAKNNLQITPSSRGMGNNQDEDQTWKSTAQESSSPLAADDIHTLAKGNNAFTAKLYRELGRKPGNLFISPYSIRTACAMNYAGARNKTAEQMRQVLEIDVEEKNWPVAFRTMNQHLNGKTGGVEIAIANSLWPQKNLELLEPFLEVNRDFFGVEIVALDYINAPEKSRRTINAAIEEKTRGKIKEVIPEDRVTQRTRLILTNTVYFKGKWAKAFDPNSTRGAPFFITPERKVITQFMNIRDTFKYGDVAGMQVLELPYLGGTASLFVVLPSEGNTLEGMESGLAAEKIESWRKQTHPREVIVYLPRFKLQWGSEDLRLALTNLGMVDAFNSRLADFSDITGKRDLYIEAVFHKTFVEVNEVSTESAAATDIVESLGGFHPPNPIFRADRPFLFFILDNVTGTVLFIGRLVDPTR